ncbi:MAG: DUF5606 domain-containing protein, partial [Prevotellaceae bacterium]|nr:DUF5606 domain-containing protein [Prevotellaceae bacterium]
MLKTILTISGKSGLFKQISLSKNMLVVESLADGKRMPSFAYDKTTTLSDIAIVTQSKDIPLREVFDRIKTKMNGDKLTVDSHASPDELRAFFAEIVPDFNYEK